MTLYKHVRELVEKFSFIVRTEVKLGLVYFYYMKNGKEVSKKLPYRANKKQLLELLERIKDDCGYSEIKKERDNKILKPKPPEGFAYTHD